ncbi:MAG TPA: hypothetical protein VGE12_05880 [Noviherbaspirillum sp.]
MGEIHQAYIVDDKVTGSYSARYLVGWDAFAGQYRVAVIDSRGGWGVSQTAVIDGDRFVTRSFPYREGSQLVDAQNAQGHCRNH